MLGERESCFLTAERGWAGGVTPCLNMDKIKGDDSSNIAMIANLF